MSDQQAEETETKPDAAGATDFVIELPVEFHVKEAEQLMDQLLDAPDDKTVVFDAEQVEAMNTPAILAIISFVNSRSEAKPPAAVLNPASAFVDAFSDLGLFQDLMKMEFRT